MFELADELAVLELEPDPLVLPERDVAATEELAENGLADPDPQPTTEAIATAAAPNFMKTLVSNCT